MTAGGARGTREGVRYYARVGDRTYECVVEDAGGELHVTVGDRRHRVDLTHVPKAHAYSLLLDGKSFEFTLHEGEEGIELSGGAGLFLVQVEDARTHAARAKTASQGGARGPRLVRAVMPGIVREVLVQEGQTVAKGDALLILEAMKMQNEVRADQPGRVLKLHVAPAATVEKGAKLVELA
jgi:biotin carboxyl carrier protein